MKRRINFKGLEDYYITTNGNIYDSNNNRIKTFINACNYVAIVLNDRIYTVAYLMAHTWLKNENKAICVGYKDNDYSNVKVDNLYWYYEGTEDDEVIIKERRKQTKEDTQAKPLYQVDKEGNIINIFESSVKAGKFLNVGSETIRQNVNNKNLNKQFQCYFIRQSDYYDGIIEEYYKINSNKIYHTRKIMMYDYNGDLIKEFNSTKEVADYLKVSYQTVNNILVGEQHQRKDVFLIYKEEDTKHYTKDCIIRLKEERSKING